MTCHDPLGNADSSTRVVSRAREAISFAVTACSRSDTLRAAEMASLVRRSMAASSTSFLIRTRVSAAAIRVRCRLARQCRQVLIDDAGDGNAALPDAAHAILESGPVDAY